MQFNSELIDMLNNSKEDFKIEYLNGYEMNDEDRNMNIFKGYTITSVLNRTILVQLKFTDPTFISASFLKCRIKISFGKGNKFKSAGFNESLENYLI